jgi:hypothetical protein
MSTVEERLQEPFELSEAGKRAIEKLAVKMFEEVMWAAIREIDRVGATASRTVDIASAAFGAHVGKQLHGSDSASDAEPKKDG